MMKSCTISKILVLVVNEVCFSKCQCKANNLVKNEAVEYTKYKNLVSHYHNEDVYHKKRKLSDNNQSVVATAGSVIVTEKKK